MLAVLGRYSQRNQNSISQTAQGKYFLSYARYSAYGCRLQYIYTSASIQVSRNIFVLVARNF